MKYMFKKILLLILGVLLSILSFLEFKKSIKKTENIGYTKFLSANKLVEENKLKEAIEEYKVALDNNTDINIKKNYELALKQSENEQSQKQEQEQKQNDEQNKEQNKQEQEQNGESNQNKEQNQGQDKNDEAESNESNKQDSQDTKNQQKGEEKSEEDQKADELRSIMQRLESNEKRAFKNNEKVLNTSENKDSENRW